MGFVFLNVFIAQSGDATELLLLDNYFNDDCLNDRTNSSKV